MDIPKDYKFQEAERKWQQHWEKYGIYTKQKHQKVYSIDTPPPTVSGQMHIGHAFSYAQGDFIARYQRMQNKFIVYPFGTDDNGLPTERLVEKLKSVRSVAMDRKKFRELCLKTIQEIKDDFIQPWKDLGISCNFKNSYSTIDKHSQRTSQLSFLRLHEQGHVYQEDSPVTWCPTCQTAIAQAEFENIEMDSHFSDVMFTVHGKELIISTTRPELIGACVAVVVHPEDPRYKSFVGKFAKVPLFNYEVPIIADQKVDQTKGSGCVMCCTFGDATDIFWWRAHHLPLKIIIDRSGKLNEQACAYKGLSVREARKKIIEDLKQKNLMLKQTPIKHPVNVHDKCGTELEILKTRQWFIRILDKKEELLEVAKKITWHPEFMAKRYEHWVENLNWDWCVSRQRHFGVPFPLWYCKKCSQVKLAEEKDLPVDPTKDKPKGKCTCGSSEFTPETDVMDTWATSSLTPQIALGWINNEKSFEKQFPMDLRVQSHDIIRTWAFYTIVKALYTHKKVPWKRIMVSGFVTLHGEKMSKSKGNVIDPIEVMKKYGADALRFWAAGSKLGEDMNYEEKDIITGKKTITKLWNASKFCIQHFKDFNGKKPKKFDLIDLWLLNKLNHVIHECAKSFENCEYAKAKTTVEDFFWHTFCDNYLEIVKDRLYNPNVKGAECRRSAQFTLYAALLTVLKILAPIMPFVTEEIYHLYFKEKEKEESIHLSSWPIEEKAIVNKEAEQRGDLFVDVLANVRQEKSKNNKPLNAEITLALEKHVLEQLEPALADLKAATKAKDIKFGKFTITFE